MRHQYGISALVSQTSFRGKPVVASQNVGCFLKVESTPHIKIPPTRSAINFDDIFSCIRKVKKKHTCITMDLAYGDNNNTILNFESYFEVRGGLGRCCVALHHGIVLGPLTLVLDVSDQFRFLGNCPPTPPLTQHFASTETQMLTLR